MPISIDGTGSITGISAGGLPDGVIEKADLASSLYLEGTFTPVLIGQTTAGTATYITDGQIGRYVRIGNIVFFSVYLGWSAHTGTGNMQITGLPVTTKNVANFNHSYSVTPSNLALTAGNILAALSFPNSTAIELRQYPTGGGAVAAVPMDTSAQLTITGHYEV